MPCNENSKQQDRLRFLCHRLAILMVICKSRTADWNPWFRESIYSGETSDEIREWPDYKTAKMIIGHMLRRYDNEMALAEKKSEAG